jgi:hypothetical protein
MAAFRKSWQPNKRDARWLDLAKNENPARACGHRNGSCQAGSREPWLPSRRYYPMLTGSMCIARKTRATMSTLQAAAPIPAFIAGSMASLWRRKDVVLVALAFEGIGFVFWSGRSRNMR